MAQISRQKIEEDVNSIIADKMGVDVSQVNSESNLEEDFGADSLDTIELIMEFERKFQISIPDEKVDAIKGGQVGDIYTLIEFATNNKY